MEDTTVTIIGIIVAAILMFLVPLVTIADRNDDIAQLTVQTITAEFVNNVIRIGKLTAEDYNTFHTRLASSGNSYDVEVEIKVLDENPLKTQVDANSREKGQNKYFSIYTNQIENEFARNDEILLKEGDIISVAVKNDSKTLSQTLKSLYYTISGEDLHIISSTSTGTVSVSGVFNE